MGIQYTPGQLREALGLSKETFRYWKRDLPVLGGARDQRPRFTPSDLLATAIVKRATEAAGIPVSRLAPVAHDLFGLCKASAWPQLERMVAVVLLDSNEVKFIGGEGALPLSEPTLVIPLGPIVSALRAHLFEAEFEAQRALGFPPFALTRAAGQ